MKRKQLIPIIAILITISTCALLPITSSEGSNTIRIGVVFPSESWREMYQPVFEEIIEPDINEYIDKLPDMRFKPDLDIEFLYEDAQAEEGQDPNVLHLEKVQYFASIGIDLIIGGFFSPQAGHAIDYMNDNEMLLLSPSSTSPGLAEPDDALFRLAPSDTIQGKAIAEMIISLGISNLIVIQNDHQVSTWTYDAFLPEYLEKGGNIHHHITYDFMDPDVPDILAEAELHATGSADEGILLFTFNEIMNILVAAPTYTTVYSLPWFGSETTAMGGRILWADAHSEVVDVVLYSPLTVPDYSSKYWEMAERYEPLPEEANPYYTANMIDAAWIITQAVLETKPSFSAPAFSINAVDIMEVLPDVASRYYGYSGWCQLDANGDRANANYEIWGYELVGINPSFVKYGWYDMWTDTVYWD
jgi:branched-chain amino acid transport system substrate-binding protein